MGLNSILLAASLVVPAAGATPATQGPAPGEDGLEIGFLQDELNQGQDSGQPRQPESPAELPISHADPAVVQRRDEIFDLLGDDPEPIETAPPVAEDSQSVAPYFEMHRPSSRGPGHVRDNAKGRVRAPSRGRIRAAGSTGLPQ